MQRHGNQHRVGGQLEIGKLAGEQLTEVAIARVLAAELELMDRVFDPAGVSTEAAEGIEIPGHVSAAASADRGRDAASGAPWRSKGRRDGQAVSAHPRSTFTTGGAASGVNGIEHQGAEFGDHAASVQAGT